MHLMMISLKPIRVLLCPIIFLFVFNFGISRIVAGEVPEDQKQKAQCEEIFDGFEDNNNFSAMEEGIEETDHLLFSNKMNFNGTLGIGASYNLKPHKPESVDTNWKRLSRLRTELELNLEADLSDSWKAYISGYGFYDWAYAIKGRDEFTDDVLDNYEDEIELGETYLQGRLSDSLNIKAGRQILVWGKSDCIRVTDVLNPIDLREPGVTDIEDLRLPTTMVRLDYLWKNFNISGAFIPEIRLNKNPEFGSDFYPFAEPIPNEDKPDSNWDNAEYGIAIEGAFSGWEVSLYWADIYKDMYIDIPHVKVVSISSETGPVLESRHTRVHMYGTAANYVINNFVLKTEAAFFQGFEFMNAPGEEFDRFDVLGGVEYYGFKDTTIIVEVANRHVINFKNKLKMLPDYAIEDEFQWIFRLEKTLLNNKLKLIFFTSTYGLKGEDGAFQRVSAEYALTDAIKINGGIVFYKSGDLFLFNDIGDNDRLFFEMKYWF